jgi:hypothetical protein
MDHTSLVNPSIRYQACFRCWRYLTSMSF